MAPERIFVAYGKHGASTVSEYRDEAEAQHGTPATEYVTEASASHAAMINDRIQARLHAGLEQMIVKKDAALAEVARFRAALAAIAALQTEEPKARAFRTDEYEMGSDYGRAAGIFEASSLARAALGGGT